MPIERLEAKHDRASFDCDVEPLNEFLRQRAGQQQRQGFSKTYVAVGEDGAVRGYVTLSAGQIQCAVLPMGHRLPRHPAPVLRVGRLAVDRRAHGLGVGKDLLAFALKLALEFSERVGIYAVVVDAKDERAAAYYRGLAFVSTLDDALCLYLPVGVLAKVGGG